jgi:hypothetical protein
MKEADVRREIYRVFRGHGYWPVTQTDTVKCPRCHALTKPPIGRPDILVLHPAGRNCVCEVKTVRNGEKGFPLSRITDEQRRWLDAWTEHGGTALLAVGTLIPRQRRLWLVEWTAWRQLEDTISPIQQSVPVVAGKGMARELQDNDLDMDHLLAEWELSRSNGTWELSKVLKGVLCQITEEGLGSSQVTSQN